MLTKLGFAACVGLLCFQSAGAVLAHTGTANQMRQMSRSDAFPTKKVMLAQHAGERAFDPLSFEAARGHSQEQGAQGGGVHQPVHKVRRTAHHAKTKTGMNH